VNPLIASTAYNIPVPSAVVHLPLGPSCGVLQLCKVEPKYFDGDVISFCSKIYNTVTTWYRTEVTIEE